MIETVAFQENPTRSTPANNVEIPKEGMLRNGTPHGHQNQYEPHAPQVVRETEQPVPAMLVRQVSQQQCPDDRRRPDQAEGPRRLHLVVAQVLNVGDEVSVHEAHGVASNEVPHGQPDE